MKIEKTHNKGIKTYLTNKMRKLRTYEIQTESCTIQKHKLQTSRKKSIIKLHEDRKEA